MKKLLVAALGLAVATSAFAQTNQVLSRNAVGYIKTTTEPNKIYLLSAPFVNLANGSDNHSVTNLLAGVPNSTVVSLWDDTAQGYISFSKSGRGVWDASAQTSVVARGKAFFVRIPGSASTNDLYIMGEVPDATTAPTTTQSRASGLSFRGHPYPVAVAFTGTAFAVAAPNSTVVSIWDASTQSYLSYSKSGRGVWDAGAQSASLQAGQGLIIRSAAAPNNWTEVKPYTWP
ncbi:MAG: hypothetical protein M5U15_11720 [Kiritimatiellae bacterium]|nr:hypothetical protein [Kiritimatiellia bacterium]